MAQHGREGLHIHAALQRQSREGMEKLVEAENEAILVAVENET